MTSSFSWRRSYAVFGRFYFLYRRSIPRTMELFFWPVMDLLVWGFLAIWLERQTEQVPGAVLMLVGAVIYWNMLYRAQMGLTISFIEELWSRSAINLFASPISLPEYLTATCAVGLCKAVISSAAMVLVAWLMYRAELWTIGPNAVWMFFHVLVFGWAIGIMTISMILRWGHAAEALTWGVPFLLQPLSAVFYPVSAMPGWLHPIAYALPSTHVFEALRGTLAGGGFPLRAFLTAGALNIAYLLLGVALFVRTFRHALRRGSLPRLGHE
ncbi:MAG: ABC transporter permease [Phycisphaerales bacterium]|nr:MAG: ABC transporter permease [Phycisphaerales bacterium]